MSSPCIRHTPDNAYTLCVVHPSSITMRFASILVQALSEVPFLSDFGFFLFPWWYRTACGLSFFFVFH